MLFFIFYFDSLNRLYSDIYLESLLTKVFIEYIIFVDKSILIVRNTAVIIINEVIIKKISRLEIIFEFLNIAENLYEKTINLYTSLILEFL